ncbi:MAG: phosphoenolpyruvate synthase [Synechococcaceae cyanobacterium RL_1_2]|nr:phosphoenolpyruvate synthase [Synechococcaceae cyanobacterium RL_1_2]
MVSTFALETDQVPSRDNALILWFEEVGSKDVGLVGGKNSSLGEMIQQLKPMGVEVPGGFATTAYAYRYFIESAGLKEKLGQIFADLDVNDMASLQDCGHQARSLVLHTPFPEDLNQAITLAYKKMCARYEHEPAFCERMEGQDRDYCYDRLDYIDVAVRSSATAEDLPEASFAGQQETYLNVHGTRGILESCHKCFASLFTDRAIAYRVHNGFDHLEVALSVGVQKMVRSDLATSGVMFSIDTETGFKNAAFITAAYGLGENVVQGAVNPDEFFVFKPTLKQGKKPILERRLGTKQIKMIYDTSGVKLTKNVPVPEKDRNRYCVSDEDVLKLAHWTVIIEEHYSAVRGQYTPMDIEWAKDGKTGELFIVQARPETVQSQKATNILRTYRLNGTGEVLVRGRSVGEMVGQGQARVITNVNQIHEFEAGEVLVTCRTDPDWEPIMKKASAIVTDQGGRTCHAAIIAREMGIPAVVGCGDATTIIQNSQEITVSCCEGEDGRIYDGLVPFEVIETSLDNLPTTKTQVLMNMGNPEQAFSLSNLPADGVGLARLEFIIANQIKVHPKALIHFDQISDRLVRKEINEITQLYADKSQFFVDKLASGISMIAAAFYPKPVIVRMSDFKSNEYANLLGGHGFEPKEENPMIGWRGASRYYDPDYIEAFELECEAFRIVRNDMGLTNVIPMVPFCRTPEEGRKVIATLARHDLKQGENDLQVYVMCELPSNVILADQFSEVFDGFSIGSNDLTQLTLGLDRDSALVAHIFDERNEAVKRMVKMAIEGAKANHRKIGICGQAPSDYPEFAQFLVELGIDSISLNPDTLLKTKIAIAEMEQQLNGESQG